jgi:Cu-Zn family superoxide dismutase
MALEYFEMMRRAALITFAALLTAAPAIAQTAASRGVETLALPRDVTFPEGIAYDPADAAVYTGSAATGTLVRIDVKTHASRIVAPAGVLLPKGETTFPAVLGMKIDGERRLWIAGGRTGRFWVVDSRSGQVIKQLEVPAPSKSLINDLAVVGGAAYFTDTTAPTLWRIQSRGHEIGPLEPWIDFTGTALQYYQGANLNGIAATADGRALIVVQMGKGLLFRIDLQTKQVSAIDTAGADLTGADGLVLDGDILYVVRQTAVEIATVRLSPDLAKGTVINRFTDPLLAWPATAAKVGDRLLVVNTQFNTRTDKKETLPFTIASVPLARLLPAK